MLNPFADLYAATLEAYRKAVLGPLKAEELEVLEHRLVHYAERANAWATAEVVWAK